MERFTAFLYQTINTDKHQHTELLDVMNMMTSQSGTYFLNPSLSISIFVYNHNQLIFVTNTCFLVVLSVGSFGVDPETANWIFGRIVHSLHA